MLACNSIFFSETSSQLRAAEIARAEGREEDEEEEEGFGVDGETEHVRMSKTRKKSQQISTVDFSTVRTSAFWTISNIWMVYCLTKDSRLLRCIVTIASLDRWSTAIENQFTQLTAKPSKYIGPNGCAGLIASILLIQLWWYWNVNNTLTLHC